ncbi:PKD domain-containing protein [Pseudoalteromonas sp. JBTF-M23]|uniref:PKD domain-containing protein n=1 Tax=Pseudoalteromonas caenipelagi TaxID=2726988 RepID=A0A849VEM8_9GAMM|nr:PKD domain-containing protein [Pseudoalteromonas caenipelagi]NOU51228.1 PKD domain-containing protein [Pseudoalteromonas caenipelagi]
MKKRYFLPVLGLASMTALAQAPLTDTQMMSFTSKTNETVIGKTATLNLALSGKANTIMQTISHPDASYIKLHFKNVNLKGGGKLVVRATDNSERYEYTQADMRKATFEKGDNGVNHFAAMSVSSDTVIVEYTPGTDLNTTLGTPVVDYYHFGIENQLSSDDLGTDSTCGAMERRDVQCWSQSHSEEFERSRPVARLVIGGRSLCTGWRVGSDNRMFTNNHCVETASELTSTEVWFNYQHTTCNGTTKETVVKVTGKDFLKTDYTLDYTLFTVNNFEQTQPFGYFGLDVNDATQGQRIYIPQHGAGNPKELSIESDEDSNGLCQVNEANANGRGTGTDLGYYCDTTGGSSGSPVVAADTRDVIALHHLGGCTNKGAKISKIWPQVSSIFNNVVPVGDQPTGDPVPVASFTYTCNLLTCQFDGSASRVTNGTIEQHEWQFGDGSNADFGSNVSHSFASSGDYTVTLKVTDDNNQTASVSKTVSVTNADDPAQLQKGVAKTDLSGDKYTEQFFYFDVPAGATDITFKMAGGTGDADMYVRKGEKPTTSTYDCRPYRWGNGETCTQNDGAGRYHVMIRAFSSFNGVQLTADYTN